MFFIIPTISKVIGFVGIGAIVAWVISLFN